MVGTSSLGAYLRDLRGRRGLSLEELARLTRVASRYLEALETDEFGELPAAVFTRGYIRAYCQALHEPVEEALALYHGQSGRTSPAAAPVRPATAPPSAESGARSLSTVLVSFILLVVLGIALFGFTLAQLSGRADQHTSTTRGRPPHRRDGAGRSGARVGIEWPVCPHHRQRRGRELRAEWPGVAAPGAQRRGDFPARPSAAAVKFLSSLGERLGAGLRRSREFLSSELQAVFEPDRPIDEALYSELEETLIAADLGAPLAADFVNRAREEVMFGTVSRAEQLRPLFRRFLTEILAPAVQPLDLEHRPAVVLMLGVNGSGKTTTCAKLAAQLRGDGKQVLLAAADTFRAAAIEQLETWGGRIGVDVIRQAAGSDPGAVVFDALKAATARNVDTLIIDTAGRLHTKSNLMAELAKLKKVIERQLPGAPHESLMVLDAPTGQNGFAQARMFHETIGVSGVILTKLDGTAKGGIVVRIVRELKLPIKLVGVGEKVEDLGSFDAERFVDALVPAA